MLDAVEKKYAEPVARKSKISSLSYFPDRELIRPIKKKGP